MNQDIIKIKGGINHSILVAHIDIKSLRKFQQKEYELQKDDGSFKPTPPDFSPQIAEEKESGKLWDVLMKKIFPTKLRARRCLALRPYTKSKLICALMGLIRKDFILLRP